MTEQNKLTYEQTGVNYGEMDPFKIAAQQIASTTSNNLEQFGYAEVAASRGESAYVWDEGEKYGAMVTEGLGTKNLVADAMREITGITYYDSIAQDTVAMIVNDLAVVGAKPKVVTAHFSVGDSSWFRDQERSMALINGFADACDQAGATWGGGETPTLKGILQAGAIELSGTAVGEISPKDELTLGEKLQVGDKIVLLRSSGIHANGLSLAREIANSLPDGYATLLPNGKSFGEELLTPTPIYVNAIRSLFNQGIDVHYMANITGHGWRKIMRANQDFTYYLDDILEPQPIFDFIKAMSGNDEREMYGNFNMGAGFAVFVKREQAFEAWDILSELKQYPIIAGEVREGPKQVIIAQKNLTFSSNTLDVRS